MNSLSHQTPGGSHRTPRNRVKQRSLSCRCPGPASDGRCLPVAVLNPDGVTTGVDKGRRLRHRGRRTSGRHRHRASHRLRPKTAIKYSGSRGAGACRMGKLQRHQRRHGRIDLLVPRVLLGFASPCEPMSYD